MRNTRKEQIISASPLSTDIIKHERHVGKVPTAEMRCYAWPAADAQIDEYELAGSSHKAIGQSA